MSRLPYGGEPETSMKVELWVGVTPSGWTEIMWHGYPEAWE